jgi:ribosome-associated toxin RatA of RatAB toxin-antitoxin module
VLAAVVAVAAALAGAAPVIDEVVDAAGVPGVRAEFDVDADPDALLGLLWDVSRFRQIFPDIQELHVEAAPDDRTVVVRFVVDAVIKQVTYTLRRRLDRQRRTIAWVSVAGDLEQITGHWIVRPDGQGKSRVTYQSVVDVGLLPGATSIYRSMVMGKLTEVIARVQGAAAKLPKPPAPTKTQAPTTSQAPTR